MSLVAAASALPMRAGIVPSGEIASHWPTLVNLLAGSLLGAWVAAGRASRLGSATRIIALLLIAIAAVLLVGHQVTSGQPLLDGTARIVAGIGAGFAIGGVASLLGVAGGELLIPTLVLLFGADIEPAGSLSLAMSLPTMLVGSARYSRDRSFAALGRHRIFLLVSAGKVWRQP